MIDLRLPLLSCCALLLGCALLSKSDPLELRYFEALGAAQDQRQPASPAAAASAGGEQAPRLRLGAVTSARHLDLRIATRRGAHELGYHETLRWTERPEEYVRRALSRDLYEQASFTRVVSGPAPTLEVELMAFEECEQGGRRRGRVELQTVLHDERVQLDQETIRVETDIDAAQRDGAEALVAALGQALSQASRRVTERTRVVLAEASR
jgi:cholesterol transport system auxiliary component